jgi:hypothetical protein
MNSDDSALSPEGTSESSPGRQSWVINRHWDQSREGRLNTGARTSAVPGGTSTASWQTTQDYVLGYFQSSLRD